MQRIMYYIVAHVYPRQPTEAGEEGVPSPPDRRELSGPGEGELPPHPDSRVPGHGRGVGRGADREADRRPEAVYRAGHRQGSAVRDVHRAGLWPRLRRERDLEDLGALRDSFAA